MYRYGTLIRLHSGIYLCVVGTEIEIEIHSFTLPWVTHTHERSISPVPAPLQHPKPAMTGIIPEEEEEEERPSHAKKIRKLQNDEEEVCEDML